MTRYRIIVQRIDGRKFTHLKNYMVKDIKHFDTFITDFKGYQLWCEEWSRILKSRAYHKKMDALIRSDLYDKKAKGKDISHKEFLENEIFFASRDV